jgi:signal transduction histidine kinase
MSLDNTGRLYLERQITLARAVIAALSLVALLETSGAPVRPAAIVFLSAYLAAAVIEALLERFMGGSGWRIPLTVDFVVLAVFVYLTPSVSAFWFLFLFTVFALATRGNPRAMLALVGVATVGIIGRVAVEQPFRWQSVWHWIAIGSGTLVSGLCMGFLGAREREHLARQEFLEKVTGLLQFDHGLTESIRQLLGELAVTFECERACLAMLEEDLERIFVWRVHPGELAARAAETVPQARSDTFLLDSLETTFGWEFKNGDATGEGFGWDRRTGERVRIPAPANATRQELSARSLLAVTIESGGRPAGRVLLVNPQPARGRFTAGDLRWLEQIVRHVGRPLENVFTMRSLRARAVEAERSRISRDLHDGVLQTLLSLKIQLDVLRRTLPMKPEQACADIANLQKTVQEESDELRRMVTEMRPVRVESADMRELMYSFAERFRSEHGMEVDLFIENRDLRIPDRICRELFQIYREALHNVKKHAKASHVVVKLEQDEAKVFLCVDDNGEGFSFSGRYRSEELDQLRLGPISIKERTRGVGGTLTVESNPGHGARLTVEIPLN